MSLSQGYSAVPYIDDLGGGDIPEVAWEAFMGLGRLLQDIGLREAEDEACPTQHLHGVSRGYVLTPWP